MIYTHNRFSLLPACYIFCLLGFCGFQQSYASCTLPRLTFAEPVALVIANSEYAKTLRQSINDANAMKTVLEEIGFRVIFKTELTERAMNQATVEFRDCLRISRGVGLFYFTGYGMQLNRKNYLLPINISIADKEDVEYDAFPVEKLFDRLRGAKNDVNIVILDACRDSPYPQVGTQKGLANVSFRGSFIAYPTEAGKTIPDQKSQNSVYISTLTKFLKQAVQNHTRIDDTFMLVANEVEQKSGGVQIPRYQISLKQQFCFGGCKTEPKIIDTRKRRTKLIVRSNADGARVFINGKNSGTIQNGKFEKELPIKRYRIRVEKPSDVSVVKSINLQETQQIEINLEEQAPKQDTNEILLPPSVGF